MYCSLGKQAKKKNNWAIGHCNVRKDLIISHERSSVAHRLALAVGQCSNKIVKVKFVLDQAEAIHRYYDASVVRSSDLRQIQEALGVEQTKLSQAIAVRWLSYDKAVSS